MHPNDDEPVEALDGTTPEADPYADAPSADPDAEETALAEQAMVAEGAPDAGPETSGEHGSDHDAAEAHDADDGHGSG